MVGAPHIDHDGEAALKLVAVIGDIGRKVRPAFVGFAQGTICVIAELSGFEQKLRPFFPVIRQLSLRRLERARIDQAALLQP